MNDQNKRQGGQDVTSQNSQTQNGQDQFGVKNQDQTQAEDRGIPQSQDETHGEGQGQNNGVAQGDDQNKDAQIEELKNALARAMADLQNFKRRSEEDRSRFVKFANVELLKNLLPIIDNFNRTGTHLPEDLKENEWVKGVMQVQVDFLKTLEKMGVKKMETIGKKLDPRMHEALLSGAGEKDVIIEELDIGYLYNGEVLKPAKVKVGDGS